MYQTSIFIIQLEPDFGRFTSSNLAEAGTGAHLGENYCISIIIGFLQSVSSNTANTTLTLMYINSKVQMNTFGEVKFH